MSDNNKSLLAPGRFFTTYNATLADSLYLAGVPLLDDSKPCLNIYDREILEKLGFKGVSLENGARTALAQGKRGRVQYSFRWTENLQELLKAFTAQEAAIKNGTGTISNEASTIRDKFSLNADAMVQVSCFVLKTRRQFLDAWKGREDLALIRLPNAGNPNTRQGTARTPDGKIVPTTIVSNPGFRMLSLNASDSTKGKLNT